MGYLKNELSDRSRWHLGKHRYLELTHFCLQYDEWRRRLQEMDILRSRGFETGGDPNWSDETARYAVERAALREKIELIEHVTREAEPDLASYILLSVTRGLAFPQMQAMLGVPCGKDMFYDRRRKFFWLLDKRRG